MRVETEYDLLRMDDDDVETYIALFMKMISNCKKYNAEKLESFEKKEEGNHD